MIFCERSEITNNNENNKAVMMSNDSWCKMDTYLRQFTQTWMNNEQCVFDASFYRILRTHIKMKGQSTHVYTI